MTTEGVQGGELPKKATAIGGVGADGKFHYMLVDDTGAISVSATAEMAAEATAAAPSYSEGQNAPLSQDLTGNLRTVLKAETTKVIGTVNIAAAQSTTDGGAGWTTVFGVSGARFTSADASGGVASVTDAPTSGQKLVITDIEISTDTAMRVDLKEETSGTILSSVYMAANSTVNLITRSKRKLATANKKLQVLTSVAGNISVGAFYYSES